MPRLAPVAAIACLFGSCAFSPEIGPSDDHRLPVLCDGKSWDLQLLKAEPGPAMMIGQSKVQQYRLDLKVRVKGPPGAWLVIGVWSFPARVHDVTRMEPDTPGAAGPQLWLFRGGGYAVEARWLEKPGDTIIRDVWTVGRFKGLFAAVIRLSVDGVSPQEWVARGGSGDHRLVDADDAPPVKLRRVCSTMLDLEHPEVDEDGGA
jgi:hypothetical protein